MEGRQTSKPNSTYADLKYKEQNSFKPKLAKMMTRIESMKKAKSRKGSMGTVQQVGIINQEEIEDESQVSEPSQKQDTDKPKPSSDQARSETTKKSDKTKGEKTKTDKTQTQVLPVAGSTTLAATPVASNSGVPLDNSPRPNKTDKSNCASPRMKGKFSSESGTGTGRSSSRKKIKKKVLAAFRKKESQKKPVDLDQIIETYSQNPDGQNESTNIKALKQRQIEKVKSQKKVLLWLHRISIGILIVAVCVSAKGFLCLMGRHWEIHRMRAILNEMNRPWKSECGKTTMYREFWVDQKTRRAEELPCKSDVVPLSKAKWTNWSECINGEKRRWRMLEAGVKYQKTGNFEERKSCSNSTAAP